MNQPVTVLHVDDDAAFADLVASFLEREAEGFDVVTATSGSDALDRLAEGGVDCVVSDYEMPGMDGLAFLARVREDYPDLPFVLFTGKGSEEVASDAISAGVTDYLQKESGTDQYAILANRVHNAVDRARAERSAKRWSTAMEAACEGVAIVDDDGRYAAVNHAYADLYGTSRDALVGERWTATVPDDEADRLQADVFPLADGDHWTGDAVGQRADGATYPKLLSLAPLPDGGHVCVVRDRTERAEREAELRRKAAKLDVLFENSPDMIDVHDADGVLVDVNRRLCDALGYAEDDLVGKRVWDVDATIDPDTAAEMWADMQPGDVRKLEVTYERSDGSTLPVDVHLAKISLDGEQRFFVISRDVTDRKERERALERQNERLERFAGVVSHDLRNPLNVAAGRLELAREDCDDPHLADAADALDRSLALVDDLLTLARDGASVDDVAAVSLGAVAADAWRSVETGDATLDVRGDSTVRADASRLQQLLENLFANAVEHGSTSPDSHTHEDGVDRESTADGAGESPPTPPVSASDGGRTDAVTVTVGAREDGDGFYVADDGSGIPAESRDSVFEDGYSTAADGTGYGLTIVADIADAHGWTVGVANGDAGGARFDVTGVTTE